MSKKSHKVPYKELLKNCKNVHGANLLLATLLVRKLRNKRKVQDNSEVMYCRTCLRTDNLEPIFVEELDCIKSEDLLFATGLEIQKDDGISQFICTVCIKYIKDHLAFREDCKRSQKYLLKYTKQNQFNQKPVQEVNNVQVNQLPVQEVNNVQVDISEIKSEEDWMDTYKYNENNVKDMEIAENNDNIYDQGIEQYEENDNKINVKPKVKKKKNCPPYKCNICKKHMANSCSLKSHLNWHTGHTSYICETCGKRCLNRTAFLQHMKGKHGLQRTDKCSYCDYLALNKEQLKIHERRHTGERPYICAHCGAGFHRRANLIQHLPIHLTIKNIQCDLCPSTFKSAKFLATHKSRSHSNKNYSYMCHICNSVYKKSFNVRKHLTKVHSIPREEQGDVVKFRVRCFGDAV